MTLDIDAARRNATVIKGVARENDVRMLACDLLAALDERELLHAAEARAHACAVKLEEALKITPDEAARAAHEDWQQKMQAAGFHGPADACANVVDEEGGMDCHPPRLCSTFERCAQFRVDMVPWDKLACGSVRRALSRETATAILAEIRKRAGPPAASLTR